MHQAILTFDLEFCHNSKFLSKYITNNQISDDNQIEKSVAIILEFLTKRDQRATFFVLGQLAEKYPHVIKKIFSANHEIASHGYSHKSLSDLNEKELKEEISLSKQIIINIINKEPKGFRAPNFSLNKKAIWAAEIIKKNFQYDSSIHPLKINFLKRKINEIPTSLGGIYFRILPLWLYCFFLKIFSKNKIPVIYFHLSDLFNFLPKIESAPWWKKLIKYWGTKNAWKKFEKLMEKYNFISIEQYLYENSSH
jgi:hypothetical protein